MLLRALVPWPCQIQHHQPERVMLMQFQELGYWVVAEATVQEKQAWAPGQPPPPLWELSQEARAPVRVHQEATDLAQHRPRRGPLRQVPRPPRTKAKVHLKKQEVLLDPQPRARRHWLWQIPGEVLLSPANSKQQPAV